jgi:hypothetical protein
MDDEQRRTDLQEAAHQCIGLALGWTLNGVTVAGGRTSAGCSVAAPPSMPVGVFTAREALTPFVTWATEARLNVEQRTLYLMSGAVAELVFARARPGRYRPPLHEEAVALAAEMPETPPADVAEMRALVDGPADSDAAQVGKLVWLAHGHDYVSAGTWTTWMEAQTRALVDAEAARIELLAGVLAHRHTMTGPAVTALLCS